MRASVVAISTLASILHTNFALNDFQALIQPKIIASECALAMEANRDPEAQFKKGTLVVDLNVTAGRFESAYISFNTRTYNGQIPGKTIKVCEGDTLVVNLWNHLGEGSSNLTNLHVHGMEVSSMGQSDNVFVAVEPRQFRRYEYAIEQSITDHIYYHPHVHLLVSSQISGLMGGNIFIVENKYHPSYPRQLREMEEVVLLLQGVCYQNCTNNRDNIFNAIISRYGVSEQSLLPNELNPNIKIRPENSMIQDTKQVHIFVNGQYGPELHMSTNKCKRLRWTNALANNVVELVMPGCMMYAMGVDGIYRKGSPVQKAVNIISPGGRSDIALCCEKAGTYWMSSDSSSSRLGQLGFVNDHRAATQKVMKIIVSENATQEVNLIADFTWKLPYDTQHLVDLRTIPASSIPPANMYSYELSMDIKNMFVDAKGVKFAFGVNQKTYDDNYINHTMVVGQVQQWQISTKTVSDACDANPPSTTRCREMVHPFHLHGFPFQIVSKSENFDPDDLLHEIGEYRDTVLLRSGLKILIRFIPPAYAVGEILTHCHIASHSDNGMAQKVRVIRA
uniref:Uncharacterized protein AlNc14C36G3194 n=1 Tax=Albugo laibachii Nc14 TaxID=890382 RepID=F0W8R9_9STRA|nr:conserved hypothetical protein [Albugo laibachii Nc14]|eukprot:CCA17527.1 conserved hypothetical protein [Albugo laibachii Nc14]